MNINRKRHELLALLFEKRAEVELKKTEYKIIGISFDHIEKSLKLTKEQLLIVTAELIELKEIGYHNSAGVEGLFCSEKGATSFANRKYLKANNARIKNNIKDVVQIIIPVLSLLITVLVITLNSSKKNREIQAIEKKVELLQEGIKEMKKNPHVSYEKKN